MNADTDTFKATTYDGHEVTIRATVGEPTARVYIRGSRLQNGFATVSTQTAFSVLHNSSVFTALELGAQLA